MGDVVTFDYDYAKAGKSGPDPMPKLVACHTAKLQSAKEQFPVRHLMTEGIPRFSLSYELVSLLLSDQQSHCA